MQDAADKPQYTLMAATLQDAAGAGCTTPAFAAAVDKLAAKYLRSVSFFSGGRVITVLLGNRSDFEEYLHILADEIPQMADRVLGCQCRIGVSRMTPELSRLHAAYRKRWKPCSRPTRPRGACGSSATCSRRCGAGAGCATGRWRPSTSIIWKPTCRWCR